MSIQDAMGTVSKEREFIKMNPMKVLGWRSF